MKKFGPWTLLILLAASLIGVSAQNPALNTLKVGDKAPLVSGKTQEEKTWNLADYVGKKVVLLYFYPKDGTPGCTMEACGLRDRMGELKKGKVEVFGVSFDNAESHRTFHEKNHLNFDLIVDTDGTIADAFGTRRAASVNVDRRVSFLIGLNGRIVHIVDDPSANAHLDGMKAAIDNLGAAK